MTPRSMNQVLKVIIVLLVIGTISGLYFANKKLVTIAQDTSKLKADVAVGDKQLKTYQQTKIQVDELSYVNELANTVLPANQDQSAIVAELSEFANRSGLTVSQITFSDTSKAATSAAPPSSSSAAGKTALTVPKGVLVVPVEIQLKSGSKYSNLLSFLKTIESNRRKSQVTNITLTPDSKDRANLSQVSIALNLYTQQPKAGTQK